MRKLIVTEFISADGFADGERLKDVTWSAEMQAFKDEELADSGAMLIGRKTYGIFAGHWPKETGDFADRFNALPKYVASTTLREVDWKPSELLKGTLLDAVVNLKQRATGNIYVHGSLNLAQQLLTLSLVDRVRLLSYPVVLGDGKRLFPASELRLDLVTTKSFSNGVVALEYAP